MKTAAFLKAPRRGLRPEYYAAAAALVLGLLALAMFRADFPGSEVVAAFCAVTGAQFIFWAFGFRSELLGTSVEPTQSPDIVTLEIRELKDGLEEAELTSAYAPSIAEQAMSPTPKVDEVSEATLRKLSWDLQQAIFQLYLRELKEEVPLSPVIAVQRLAKENLVTPELAHANTVFWQLRNRIAHGQETADYQQLSSLVDFANSLRLFLSAPTVHRTEALPKHFSD